MSDNSKSNNLQPQDNAKGDSQVVMNYDAEKLQIPTYRRILVTDDGKEYSNKAINHAMAISNMSGAEVVLLRVIEDVSKIEDTSVKVEEGKGDIEGKEISNKPASTDTAPKDFSKNDDSKADNQIEDLKTAQSDISTPTTEYTTTNTSTDTIRSPTNSMSPSSASSLQTTIKGPMVEEMEDTIKACRAAGYKNKISYKFRAGEKIDQIVDEINSKDYDMVILTSKNINSWYKSLFSDTRKIIGNIDVPVLIAQ